MSNQDKVNAYLESDPNLKTSLIFLDMEKEIPNSKRFSLEEWVTEILRLAEIYASINEGGEWETRSGAARSCIDIWRHLKYFKPEVSIFEVMEAMYKIRDQLGGQFCGGC